MTHYKRNPDPNIERADIYVGYDNHRNHWKVFSNHVQPYGVLSKHDTKKSAVKEARKIAKSDSVRPSRLTVEQKNWSGVQDQEEYNYD